MAPDTSSKGDWTLAIDFGTTYTCAVMSFGEQTEVVLVNGDQRMPSAVLSDPNGNLVVGKLAELQAVSAPDRLERNPKRRLGDGIFLLGGEPVQVIKAVAEVLRTVADEATRSQGGDLPTRLRLTHPARWAVDGVYVRTLAEAVALARLPDPSFVSEPVAAARYFARGDVAVGSQVAVYDLGGGTFDTSVLRRTADGFELMGRPGGIPDLGGEDFDELVYQFLGSQLPEEEWVRISRGEDREARRLRLELRHQARETKEALSVRPEWSFPAPAPLEGTLRITREEFEDLIEDRIEETLDELQHTIDSAGTTVDAVSGTYLAGGSSRIPLVQRMVAERFGPKVQMLDEPKTVVARGAAVADEGEVGNLATHGAGGAPRTDGGNGKAAPPPKPRTEPSGQPHDRRPFPRRGALIGAGALAAVAAILVALLVSGGSSPSRNAATTTTTSLAAAVAGSGGSTPYLGLRVSSEGAPVTGSNGQQLSITDASGNIVKLTGVKVTAVAPTVKVSGATRTTPAAAGGLKVGDVIWGISQVSASQFSQVVNGNTISSFLSNYATTRAKDGVYVYFYDPTTGRNHSSNPTVIQPVDASAVSPSDIDCTTGC